MKSSLTSSTKDKMVTRPDQGPQSFRCQPDLSTVISAPTPAVQVSAGQLEWEFYAVGHFNHSVSLASNKYSSLLRGGTLIHQTPWCLLCLPCAAIICFGTADLWTASRHTVIFPSDSIKKGKHINYSSLGATFTYPASNRIFLCV